MSETSGAARPRRPIPIPRIAALPAGDPPGIPERVVGLGPAIRRLHLNESPLPPSPRVIAAVQEAVLAGNRYPDHSGRALTAALAAQCGIAPDRIILGAGSGELIRLAAEAVIEPEGVAVVPLPSFPSYGKAILRLGGRMIAVPTREDGAMDVPAMLEAARRPDCRIVFAASPNNPTGGLSTGEEVERLAEGVPEDVLLFFDEAYCEFGRAAGGPNVLPILARRKGAWLATRSFSKAYALAGLRVGYGFAGTAALAAELGKLRLTFGVSPLALAAALAALGDQPYSRALIAQTARERDRLSAGLARLGFAPLPSAANFLTALSPIPARPLVAALEAEGVLVLPVAWPGTPEALRITIGTAEDTDVVLSLLAREMGRNDGFVGSGVPSPQRGEG